MGHIFPSKREKGESTVHLLLLVPRKNLKWIRNDFSSICWALIVPQGTDNEKVGATQKRDKTRVQNQTIGEFFKKIITSQKC